MNWLTTDLRKNLDQEETRLRKEEVLLQEAEGILQQDAEDELAIVERLHQGGGETGLLTAESLDPERIYSGEAIRNLCVKFRLRFLDTRYFKGDFPAEALYEIRRLEKDQDRKMREFRIVAPGERFALQDSRKDPLLFAPLADGRFYLVHQWGNDMSLTRHWLNFPFRNAQSLIMVCVALALLITTCLPGQWFVAQNMPDTLLYLNKAFTFFILTVFLFTTTLIVGILRVREFSADQWNSRFFN